MWELGGLLGGPLTWKRITSCPHSGPLIRRPMSRNERTLCLYSFSVRVITICASSAFTRQFAMLYEMIAVRLSWSSKSVSVPCLRAT